jgi:hypothetical protein
MQEGSWEHDVSNLSSLGGKDSRSFDAFLVQVRDTASFHVGGDDETSRGVTLVPKPKPHPPLVPDGEA